MGRIRDTVFEVIARYMNGTITLEAAEKQISWLNRLCAGANAQEEKKIKIKARPGRRERPRQNKTC
jgi:hypothetical protein